MQTLNWRNLMLGISLLLPALANAKSKETLITCFNESGRVSLFEVAGDLSQFTGARITYQFDEVQVRNTSNKTPFPGTVTLTKTTPYQYVLNGYSDVKKVARGEQPSIWLYGVSVGTEMVVTKNTDNVSFRTYTCKLNPKLILNP